MLHLAADSVTATGHRLITVVTDRPATGLQPAAVNTVGARTVITGTLPLLRDLLGEQLDRIVGEPRLVDDTDLHAPFVLPGERRRLDLSMCGVLGCARASRGGAFGGPWNTDAARYLQLLTGGDLTAMRHVALPVTHRAFAGRGITDGRFGGWITWAEMITWRGQP